MDYRNYIGCFGILLAGVSAYSGDLGLAILCICVSFFAAITLLNDHFTGES